MTAQVSTGPAGGAGNDQEAREGRGQCSSSWGTQEHHSQQDKMALDTEQRGSGLSPHSPHVPPTPMLVSSQLRWAKFQPMNIKGGTFVPHKKMTKMSPRASFHEHIYPNLQNRYNYTW